MKIKSISEMEDVIKECIEKQEKEYIEQFKESRMIEDAVLILHPKLKKIIVESDLAKATILWNEAIEDNKAYMVTDKELKENIRNMVKRNEGSV